MYHGSGWFGIQCGEAGIDKLPLKREVRFAQRVQGILCSEGQHRAFHNSREQSG
jgi:hypothetical protein